MFLAAVSSVRMSTLSMMMMTVMMLLLSPAKVSAFPSLLVNACDRPMAVGQVIMGFPILPQTDAGTPEYTSLDVLTKATDQNATSVCGTTVTQGQALSLAVDPFLVTNSLSDGFNAGVGPNYLVGASNALITTTNVARIMGCGNTRIVNPVDDTSIVPLEAGEMVVQFIAAPAFGQAWAANECTVTVTGNRAVARVDGFLVDADVFDNQPEDDERPPFSEMPYVIEAQDLLKATNYAVLEKLEDDTFDIKYNIRNTANQDIVAILQALPLNETNIQVSIIGFQDETDPTIVEPLSIMQCTSENCDGFYSIPTDQVCFTDGLCIESSVVDQVAQTITVTIVSNDDAWFAMGFTTSGGGMNGGGGGSDIFACFDEGLKRFLVNQRANPSTSAADTEELDQDDPEDEVIQNLCVLDTDAGTGRMTFTRPLTEGQFRPIIQGTPQALIYARGSPGDSSMSGIHPTNRRAEVSLDLTNLASGASTVKIEPSKILWCHIVFMSLSWGFCLPIAVVIASRTRNVTGGQPGAWFKIHKTLARLGWLLQTVGFLCAIYHIEVEQSEHWNWEHSKLGLFVVLAGFLQPISAVLRPHPPKDGWPDVKPPIGRTLFEWYHKGIGWIAVICGIVNVFLGVDLVKDLGYTDVTKNLPISIGSIGAGCATLYFALGTIMPDNPIAKVITGAKNE